MTGATKMGEISEILLRVLDPLSPKVHGNYIKLQCPKCSRPDAFVYPKAGFYSFIICNHRDSCGYKKQIRNKFEVKCRDIKNEIAKKYFDSHGLNLELLVESGIVGEDGSIKLGTFNGEKFRKTLKPEKGKQVYKFSPTGFNKDFAVMVPVLHPGDEIIVFDGVADWLHGIQDGITCTTSLFGCKTLPDTDQGIATFQPFKSIKICYDEDKAGLQYGPKLGLFLKEKFPDKEISILRLPFNGNPGKDFCDWRREFSLDDFRGIEPVKVEPRKTKRELKAIEEKTKAPKRCKFCGENLRWNKIDQCFYNLDGARHSCERMNVSWIDFDSNGNPKLIIGRAAEEFYNRQSGNIIYYNKKFWRYASGVWSKIDDQHIKTEVQQMIGADLSKKAIIEDVAFQVSNLAFKNTDFQFNPNPWLLNFKNGILHAKTGEWIEHDRKYFQNIQMDFEYSPEAKCEQWVKFLVSLGLEQSTYFRLQEWAGYCLVPVTLLETCLYLKGEGSNGKGVFLETISGMLGGAVSNLEMGELFDKFKVSEINGKLANICTDIETSKVLDARFKKLVSGEPQAAEEKYKDPFTFRPFAKFLFSANDFLPTKDRSYGFFRRFDIVEFNKTFKGTEKDKGLKRKLVEELPGVFLWSFIGLKRLMQNDWNMTTSKEMEKVLEDFQESTNPLKQFLDDACETGQDYSVNADTFRKEYFAWCEERNYQMLSENKIGREMKRLGHPNKRTRIGAVRKYVYLNARFADDYTRRHPFDN
jgi:putative DNA primase/helicase